MRQSRRQRTCWFGSASRRTWPTGLWYITNTWPIQGHTCICQSKSMQCGHAWGSLCSSSREDVLVSVLNRLPSWHADQQLTNSWPTADQQQYKHRVEIWRGHSKSSSQQSFPLEKYTTFNFSHNMANYKSAIHGEARTNKVIISRKERKKRERKVFMF